MALAFNTKPVATLKGKTSDGSSFSVSGITTDDITPAQAAAQVNKLYSIGGKTVVADKNMVRSQVEEVVDDD